MQGTGRFYEHLNEPYPGEYVGELALKLRLVRRQQSLLLARKVGFGHVMLCLDNVHVPVHSDLITEKLAFVLTHHHQREAYR